MDFRSKIMELSRTDWHGTKPGLHRIRALLKALGDPQMGEKPRFIHVAGTNGKGSSALMTASILSAAGYRTGLFTSPYVERFNERFRIDGELISDEAILELIEKLRPAVGEMQETLGELPTEFEIYTAMALLYFQKENCDMAVMECGMGGRSDSTNILPSPILCLITNIGLDHTETIGPGISDIAEEKAGIIKPGSRVILYPQREAPESIFEAAARREGALLLRADAEAVELIEDSLTGQRFHFKEWKDLRLPLLGEHQRKNAAVVLTGVEALREAGLSIPETAIREGLSKSYWPARMELMGTSPLFLLDGGHNPQCVEALMEAVETYCKGMRRIFLVGVMADKDHGSMFSMAAEHCDAFVCVRPENPRALSQTELCEQLLPYGKPAVPAASIREGVELAKKMTGENGMVAAFGSLYMAGSIRSALKNL